MPGENCAVFGCGSSRRKKGIGIWKLPKAKDESYAKWRDEWLGEIKSLQIPAARGYGVCLNRTLLSGSSRGIFWKSTEVGQT